MSFSKEEISGIYHGALEQISGARGEPVTADFAKAVRQLEKIANVSPLAKSKLAVLTELGAGTPQDFDKANEMFLAAAMSGFPPLLRELGLIILMAGTSDALAGTLLKRAALSGDWIATFLIAREAGRGRRFLDKPDLQNLANQLNLNIPFRDEIINKINSLNENVDFIKSSEFRVEICQKALSAQSGVSIKEGAVLHPSMPEISTKKQVLSPLACDYLIAMSSGIMQPSKVVDAAKKTSVAAGYRTSDGAVLLPHMMDKPLLSILWELSAAAGIMPERGEFLSLLRYWPGQEYQPHHDYLAHDAADYSKVAKCGQRCATLLTYLNEGYEGGETAFPALDIEFKGQTGDSLYFSNADARGKPIPDSLHAGLPILAGEKWLATLWIREKVFWPWSF